MISSQVESLHNFPSITFNFAVLTETESINNFLILRFQGYIFKFSSYKYEVLVQYHYHGHISLLFIIYNFIIYYSKMGYFRSISNVECEFIAMLNVLVK